MAKYEAIEIMIEGAQRSSNGIRRPDKGGFFRTLVEAMPECIKVVGPDGRLLQMNSAGLRMIEAPSFDRVRGVSIFDLIAQEHRDSWRAHHERICRGEHLTWEFDIIGLAGTRRNMQTRAVPVDLEDGTHGQLAITRDVTARNEAERSLHQVNEILEAKVSERTHALQVALDRLQETERSSNCSSPA